MKYSLLSCISKRINEHCQGKIFHLAYFETFTDGSSGYLFSLWEVSVYLFLRTIKRWIIKWKWVFFIEHRIFYGKLSRKRIFFGQLTVRGEGGIAFTALLVSKCEKFDQSKTPKITLKQCSWIKILPELGMMSMSLSDCKSLRYGAWRQFLLDKNEKRFCFSQFVGFDVRIPNMYILKSGPQGPNFLGPMVRILKFTGCFC